MTDPLKVLGLKSAVVLAGFVGGLVALQELEGLTRWKVATALFTSLAVAGYGTPLVVQLTGVQDGPLRYSIAFLLGLCAMRIVPLVQSSIPSLWNKLILRNANQGPPRKEGSP